MQRGRLLREEQQARAAAQDQLVEVRGEADRANTAIEHMERIATAQVRLCMYVCMRLSIYVCMRLCMYVCKHRAY